MTTHAFRRWEIAVAGCVTVAALWIPLALSLSPPLADSVISDLALSLIFAADLAFRLRRGERSPAWIAVDVIAAIPFSVLPLIPACRVCTLVKLARVVQLMHEIWRGNLHKSLTLRLGFFQYWLAILTHWFTCGWLTLRGLAADDAWTMYNQSLYFVVTTLTTVGYGDVTASTNAERLFVMLMMLFGVGVFGYVIGNVASVLTRIDPARAHHEEQLEKLEAFVRYKSIPRDLHQRLATYYSHLWTQRLGYDESAIVDSLPPSLRLSVTLYLKREIIHKVPLFQDASDNVVRDIATHLLPVVYLPGDVVFNAGDPGNSMYFVSRGELEVISKDDRTVLSVLRDGDFFGEVGLTIQQQRSARVQAKTFCDLYRLDKQAFDHVLAVYPDIAAKIQKYAVERSERA